MRLHRTARHGLVHLLVLAACATGLAAQAREPATKAPDCQQDALMDDNPLLGQWTGSIEGQPRTVQLQLGPHPQWKGTVKGTIERTGDTRPMVGDVDDGSVTLEESADGQRISATWLGNVVDGSCAREIRGDYIEGEDAAPKPFVLRKLKP